MRRSPALLILGFLITYVALPQTGCSLIGSSIGSAIDAGHPAPGTTIPTLSKIEEGELYRVVKIDGSVVLGEYVVVQGKDLRNILAHNLDVDLVADSVMQPVDLRIGMDVGGQVVFVPIDSIAYVATAEEVPSTGRTVGRIVGTSVDIAVVMALCCALAYYGYMSVVPASPF